MKALSAELICWGEAPEQLSTFVDIVRPIGSLAPPN
jgi:hypothetical protein